MKERMIINTWYELSEKYPPRDEIVLCTINGLSNHLIYKDTFALLIWTGENWVSTEGVDFEELEVLAWCDIEPYGITNRKKVNKCTATTAEQS